MHQSGLYNLIATDISKFYFEYLLSLVIDSSYSFSFSVQFYFASEAGLMVYNNKRYSKHISFVSRSLGRSCLESHFIPRCSQRKRQAVSKVILNRWKHPNERVPSAITNWIRTLFVLLTLTFETKFKWNVTKYCIVIKALQHFE